MRDEHDKKTRDLLQTPGAGRQAAYAARQRELGRRQRNYWLTDAEAEAVAQCLDKLRAGA